MTKFKFLSFLILSLSLACPIFAASNCGNSMEKTQDQRAQVALGMARAAGGNSHIASLTSLDALLSIVGIGYNEVTRTLLASFLGDSVAMTAAGLVDLNVDKPGLKVSTAFNVWVQENIKLKAHYLRGLQSIFKIEPQTMDVTDPKGVADRANSWIGDRTDNMLGEVVTPDMITSDLVTLLVNAIYFKGSWKQAFDPNLTKARAFWGVDKQSGKVTRSNIPTMMKNNVGMQVSLVKGDKQTVVVVRLPYEGDTHAMYLSFGAKLSDKSTKNKPIYEVDTGVDVNTVFTDYIVKGAAYKTPLYELPISEFTMPKFTIMSRMKDVQRELANAGLGGLFVPGVLTAMSSDPRLYLGFILQVAKIEVDEFGSKAAVATVGGTRSLSAVVEPVTPVVNVNGPFSYAIRDEENDVNLFEGMFSAP